MTSPGQAKPRSFLLEATVVADEQSWRAFVPDLEARGVATWGATPAEALRNLHDVAQMVLEDMVEAGEPIPASVVRSDGPLLPVSL